MLLGAFVQFLDLHMKGVGDAGRYLRKEAELSVWAAGVHVDLDSIWRTHSLCAEVQSKLRLLADGESFKAAYAVHTVYDEYLDLTKNPDRPTLDNDLDELQTRFATACQRFVEQVRSDLRLSGKASNLWVSPSGQESRL